MGAWGLQSNISVKPNYSKVNLMKSLDVRALIITPLIFDKFLLNTIITRSGYLSLEIYPKIQFLVENVLLSILPTEFVLNCKPSNLPCSASFL